MPAPPTTLPTSVLQLSTAGTGLGVALGFLLPGVGWLLAGDWIGGVTTLLLWAIWFFLPPKEGPPVLSLALTFQWLQVNIGVFYWGLTQRPLDAIILSDYRRMALLGSGCVAALLVGLVVATRRESRQPLVAGYQANALSTQTLLGAYLALAGTMGFIHAIAWQIPLLTQGILAISFLRLVSLYLLFRRLTHGAPHWGRLLPLLGFEMLLGFTGFFAGFREPLMLLALAFLERFEARKVRHWIGISVAAVLAFVTGLLWMSIRIPYRADFELDAFAGSRSARLERIGSLSAEWFSSSSREELMYDLDSLVDRIWAIYYPALAVARVPEVLPHEDGRILWGAVRHVLTPRILFPNKAPLASDSEMVRKYSGVWVAGEEQGTSIAFGYAAESYVDFGVPLMFLPSLVWGWLMGQLYLFIRRSLRFREIAVGLATVVMWMALYLFERSWIKTLGFSFTLLIYLGGAVWLIDRFLFSQRLRLLGPAALVRSVGPLR